MPIIRRCPKCGDDLLDSEAVCSFCGTKVGLPGRMERFRRSAEDYYILAAALLLIYLTGLNLLMGLADWIHPGASAPIRENPWVERAMRAGLTSILPVWIWLEGRNKRRRQELEREREREREREERRGLGEDHDHD